LKPLATVLRISQAYLLAVPTSYSEGYVWATILISAASPLSITTVKAGILLNDMG